MLDAFSGRHTPLRLAARSRAPGAGGSCSGPGPGPPPLPHDLERCGDGATAREHRRPRALLRGAAAPALRGGDRWGWGSCSRRHTPLQLRPPAPHPPPRRRLAAASLPPVGPPGLAPGLRLLEAILSPVGTRPCASRLDPGRRLPAPQPPPRCRLRRQSARPCWHALGAMIDAFFLRSAHAPAARGPLQGAGGSAAGCGLRKRKGDRAASGRRWHTLVAEGGGGPAQLRTDFIFASNFQAS